MNFRDKLNTASRKNSSLLCVGLDTDKSKIPASATLFSFNQHIVDETKELVCAYKPNIAFYEMYGTGGLDALIKTIDYIHQETEVPVILDAKRGDIGNSSAAYARAVFEIYQADAVTVSPYMGEDSLKPFFDYKDKGVFVLCLTSNPGAKDFQPAVYKEVAKKFKDHGLVAGATDPEKLAEIRKIAPETLLLIPGIGAQGGELGKVLKIAGKNIIINASRSIIYADDPGSAAQKLRDEINEKIV